MTTTWCVLVYDFRLITQRNKFTLQLRGKSLLLLYSNISKIYNQFFILPLIIVVVLSQHHLVTLEPNLAKFTHTHTHVS